MEVCGNRAKQRRLAARRRRRLSGRLAIGLIVLLAAATLAGCSPALETDQARLCRMALPALMPQDARIAILAQTPDADGRGLSVAFTAETPGAKPAALISPPAAFASPDGRANRATSTSLTLDGRAPLGSAGSLFSSAIGWRRRRAGPPILRRIGDLSAVPVAPHAVAYGLQMALGRSAARRRSTRCWRRPIR